MKKAKIIATVGPSCSGVSRMRALIRAGTDVFRINASHTPASALAHWVRSIRKASQAESKSVAVVLDLQGPRIRTGKLRDGKAVWLKQGDEIRLETGDHFGTAGRIVTPYRRFSRIVKKGGRILIDNGTIALKVLAREGDSLRCRVMNGGVLGENKGINLPQVHLSGGALTAKDRQDLRAGIKAGVDYVALSFVRSDKDIIALRNRMRRLGRLVPIIAKIEKPEALKNIKAILAVADGIMVARGDLGIEMGVEKIPMAQKRLIEQANRYEVPVITATQMLESMITEAHPTRAEVSDVANAIFDGTDAVMLSGETAVGKNSLASVRTMAGIVAEAERHLKPFEHLHRGFLSTRSFIHAAAHAGQDAARELRAKALVVFTVSGRMAAIISKLKPAAPILALTPSKEIFHRLALLRGVLPILHERVRSTDKMVQVIDRAIVKRGLLNRGDTVVIVSGRQAFAGARYMTKIHRIGEA